MASASFRSVGHVRSAPWPRGCYCRYKMAGVSAFYAKHTDFLHFYDAVHVPSLPCRPSVCHIAHCTHKTGTYSRQSCCRLQSRSYTCSIFPAHRPSHWREGAHNQVWGAQAVVTACILMEATPFFKGMFLGCPSRPCSFVSLVYGGGPQK